MVFLRCKTVYLLMPFLIFFGLSLSAYSVEITNGCHCFRNRTFNPADTFAADDYLLATTSNSLLAGHFNISKRKIIMMKMQGSVSNNDLLIGLYIAAESDTDISRVLAFKEQRTKRGEKSWHDTLQNSPELSRAKSSDKIIQLINNGLSDALAGDEIVNIMLYDRFSAVPGQLRKLRKDGLSSPETVLTLTLADYTGTAPQTILSLRKNGLSWSAIAHNFGLTPADVGKLLISSPKTE